MSFDYQMRADDKEKGRLDGNHQLTGLVSLSHAHTHARTDAQVNNRHQFQFLIYFLFHTDVGFLEIYVKDAKHEHRILRLKNLTESCWVTKKKRIPEQCSDFQASLYINCNCLDTRKRKKLSRLFAYFSCPFCYLSFFSSLSLWELARI